MELKKEPVQEPGTGKLVNSDYFADPSSTIDEAHRRYSDDYSRSGTNTGYAGTAINEWGEDIEKNSFKVSKEQMAEILAPTKQDIRNRNARFLKVSEYIMYAIFVLVVVFLAVSCIRPGVDILVSLHNLPVFLIILEAYIIFDAILAYNLGEKKISLFMFAIFLGALYPICRNRILAGNGIGIAVSVLTVIAFIMVGVNAGRAYNSYGQALFLESEHTRHEIVSLYDQTLDNGQHIGLKLRRRFTLSEAEATMDKSGSMLVLTGTGTIFVDNLGATNEDNVPTVLTFVKEAGSNKYELKNVNLKGEDLDGNSMIKYWTTIEKTL